MRKVYQALALLIALGVAVQAASVAYGTLALFKWVQEGGTLDKAVFESEGAEVGGVVGFIAHGVGGMMVIPIIVLLFLVSSFFAKVPGGVKWALIVFGVTVVQVALGLFAHEMPGLGWLHGLNAMIMFGVAVTAAMRAGRVDVAQRARVPVGAGV